MGGRPRNAVGDSQEASRVHRAARGDLSRRRRPAGSTRAAYLGMRVRRARDRQGRGGSRHRDRLRPRGRRSDKATIALRREGGDRRPRHRRQRRGHGPRVQVYTLFYPAPTASAAERLGAQTDDLGPGSGCSWHRRPGTTLSRARGTREHVRRAEPASRDGRGCASAS